MLRPLSGFKDLFSKQSKGYAASRPPYPKALFDFITGLAQEKELAWEKDGASDRKKVTWPIYLKVGRV